MKFNQFLLAVFVVLFGLAACSQLSNNNDPQNGDNDKNQKVVDDKAAAPKAQPTDNNIDAIPPALNLEDTIKFLDENMEDVRKNPDKYKEKVEFVREAFSKDPEYALDKAGVAHFFKPDYISWPFGIGFMVVGLLLACLGRRIFKMFLGVTGFIVGGSVVLYAVIQIESLTRSQFSAWVFWISGICGGFMGSYFFNKAWKMAIYALSAYGGVMGGFWILGMLNGTRVLHYIQPPSLFLGLCAIICLICAKYVDELVVITASSLIGGFTVVFGFDMIKCVGFRVFVKNTIDNTRVNIVDHIVEHLHHEIRFCMLAVLSITVIGVYVQYRFQPRSYDRD